MDIGQPQTGCRTALNSPQNDKNPTKVSSVGLLYFMAEGEGIEPSRVLPSSGFEPGAVTYLLAPPKNGTPDWT